jgi:CBS domain-containing protein
MTTLGSLMVKNVETLTPETTVREAASRMKRANVGALPVCRDEKPIGMVTDRDLVTRSLARGADPATTPVAEVMSSDIVTCTEDDSVVHAACLMQEKRVGRVLIVDRDDRLKGIVSLGTLVRHLDRSRLAQLVEEKLEKLDSRGALVGIIGGAIGVATLAAGTLLLYRKPELRTRVARKLRVMGGGSAA